MSNLALDAVPLLLIFGALSVVAFVTFTFHPRIPK